METGDISSVNTNNGQRGERVQPKASQGINTKMRSAVVLIQCSILVHGFFIRIPITNDWDQQESVFRKENLMGMF